MLQPHCFVTFKLPWISYVCSNLTCLSTLESCRYDVGEVRIRVSRGFCIIYSLWLWTAPLRAHMHKMRGRISILTLQMTPKKTKRKCKKKTYVFPLNMQWTAVHNTCFNREPTECLRSSKLHHLTRIQQMPCKRGLLFFLLLFLLFLMHTPPQKLWE